MVGPTGGSTDFDYEANDFDEEKSMINDHSLYQAKTLIAKSQLLVYDNQLTKSFANDTLNLSDEYIDYDPIQQVSLYAHLQVVFRFSSTALCSVGASGMLTFDIYDSTGRDLVSKDYQYFNQCTNGNTNSCLVCSSPVSTYNTDLNLVPGKYIVKVHCDNSLTTLQDIRFTFTYYTTVSASSIDNLNASARYSYAGGLRIRRITDHDGINPANDKIKKYIYHYFEDRDQDGTLEEYSYGRRMCKPQYNAFEWSDEHYVQTTGLPGDFSYMAPHYMRSSDSNVPLNGSAGGAVVGYDHVTVLYGENGENGKSEYSYINDPDQVSPYSEGGGLPCRPPYSASVPNPLNGSLIQEKDYKNVGGNFIIVKSIDNTYHLESFTNQGNENKVYGMEVRTPVLFEYGDSHTFTGTGSLPPCSSYLLSYLTLQSEWPHLDKTVEKDYAQNDTTSFNETVTNYFYDYKNYLPNKIVRNNSKNESLTSVTSYPFDYTTVTGSDAFSLGVKNLQAAHVYNTPVETYTSISNADGSNLRTVGAGLNSFQSAKPFPSVIYSSILSAPSASFAPASTSSGGSTKDASYKALIDFDSYDASGNILQQHKDNDVIHSYIWDYNSSLPVAEVANADNLSIAYSSFEADGKGNWTYSGTPSSTGGAITGSQSYLLSSGSITKSALTAANKYIISYWSKGTVSITGGTISSTLNGKSINGWQYHEVIITGATSISISGSVYIDELRLYPYDAQMTTYTYQPLIGLTSHCGTDNRIQYYEYDGLGRLQDIKDADGNIIKTFEYHYQQ
jgi:YD repeat-containing protein